MLIFSFPLPLQVTKLKPEDQEIGQMFCEQADSLQNAYVEVREKRVGPQMPRSQVSPFTTSPNQYCCNFDEAAALLNEYNADPNKKLVLTACHENVKERTNCWDLNSFLIKPVQRILKSVVEGDILSHPLASLHAPPPPPFIGTRC